MTVIRGTHVVITVALIVKTMTIEPTTISAADNVASAAVAWVPEAAVAAAAMVDVAEEVVVVWAAVVAWAVEVIALVVMALVATMPTRIIKRLNYGTIP